MNVLDRSLRDVLDLQARVAAISDDDHEASIIALRALADHPCASHLVDVPVVLDTIAEHQRAAGLDDDAAATMRERELVAEPADEPCPHCGLTPAQADAEIRAGSRQIEQRGVPRAVALAWFPADEWPIAVERWPDLLDELPADHREYCQRFEARIKRHRAANRGISFAFSPLRVGELDDWAAQHGYDAGTAEARAALAGHLLHVGRSTPWPPERNDPCWCQSGAKYKRCCGPIPAEAEAEPSATGRGESALLDPR